MYRSIKHTLGRLLPKSQFVRSVGVLVGGTASSQLLMIIAAPILTRIYSPEDFGIFAAYSGVLTLFAVVASMRYEFAILIPDNNKDAGNIVFLCLLIVLFTVLISSVFVYTYGTEFTTQLNVPRLDAYLWWLPVGVFFLGSYKVLNYWAIRQKNFRVIARTKIKQSVATLGMQLIAFAAGPVALISGQALGQGVGSLNLVDAQLKLALFEKKTFHDIFELAKRYRAFPLFSSWSAILDTIGSQLSVLMIVAYFSPAAAGLYMLSYKVLALPVVVAGTAIGNVFMSNVSGAYQEGRLGILAEKIYSKLAHIALPPMLTLALIAPDFFQWVFGSEWRQAGEFARWMSPWVFAVFVTLPLNSLFEVLEKQQYELAFRFSLCVTKITAVSIGALLANINLTIIIFSLGTAVCWFSYLWWINHKVGNSGYTFAANTILVVCWALAVNIPIIFAYASDHNIVIYTVITLSLILVRSLFMFKRLL